MVRNIGRGHLLDIPVPDNSVDIVISNSLLNQPLYTPKDRMLAEMYRVLKPGGRIAVLDIVIEGQVAAAVREAAESYTGRCAGILTPEETLRVVEHAGFMDVSFEPRHLYTFNVKAPKGTQPIVTNLGAEHQSEGTGRVVAGFVRANKPLLDSQILSSAAVVGHPQKARSFDLPEDSGISLARPTLVGYPHQFFQLWNGLTQRLPLLQHDAEKVTLILQALAQSIHCKIPWFQRGTYLFPPQRRGDGRAAARTH